MDIDIDILQFVDRYVAVWNEPDLVARRRLITGLWDVYGVQTNESARYQGHGALEARISEAHNTLVRDAANVFWAAGDATGHHDMVTSTTHMGPEVEGDIAWTGRVFVTLGENGLIRADHQFAVNTPIETRTGPRATVQEFLRRLGEGDPQPNRRTVRRTRRMAIELAGRRPPGGAMDPASLHPRRRRRPLPRNSRLSHP
ncbi:hypothetical protein AB0H42_01015 [Nocardia sp. NPDC050799]|uniref:hypothetical protein n=1 Tax=Nocardia sp. NPDC050799 TaxID=3154842 RepID=UPI0033C52312